jgi:RNA polymerase sigma factor (sigma-70 family)
MDAPRRKLIHDAMVRLSDGDRSALQILIDELWPVILAFAQRGIAHPDGDAEDVAQEVFVRICSRISDFDRARDGLSWAFAIAGYEILTHRRRARRRREVPVSHELQRQPDPTASQEDALIQQDLADALADAIGHLTDGDRAALGIGEAPSRDASIAGDVVVGDVQNAAARKRRQRALGRLRTVWRRLHGEP